MIGSKYMYSNLYYVSIYPYGISSKDNLNGKELQNHYLRPFM